MEQTKIFNAALSSFPDGVQEELRATLSEKGHIPSTIVANWLDIMGIEIGHLMIQLLPVAAAYARVPISNFHVGAVALGIATPAPFIGPGSLYLGANMEFTGQAISFCVHGEQSATNNAWLHGETGLQALAINAAPCGYCRQFLYELTTAQKGFSIMLKANDIVDDYSYTLKPLTYYLPDAFGPGDLGIKGGLMEKESHGMTITSSDPASVDALNSANACYSPYTYDYSGVTIVDSNGTIFSGRYAENAAYNPSMSPLESALAYMNMNSNVQTPYNISRTILVEPSSKISQRSATEAVLSSVAPSVTLEYIKASGS